MSLMTTGCRLMGSMINPGSVVNGLASTLWLDSETIKEIDIYAIMLHGQIMGSCIVSQSGNACRWSKGKTGLSRVRRAVAPAGCIVCY